jgi:hypothetical protein
MYNEKDNIVLERAPKSRCPYIIGKKGPEIVETAENFDPCLCLGEKTQTK